MRFPYVMFSLVIVGFFSSVALANGEQSFLLKWPKHSESGAYFDAQSSVHGICKVMGYQYGVEGSISYSAHSYTDVIEVDSEGVITYMDFDYPVDKVYCVNRTGVRPKQTAVLVKSPKHSESGAYFDAQSSVHGICKVMGYKSGVEGSISYSSHSYTDVIQVDSDGVITYMDFDYPVDKVYCLKKE